MAKANYYLCDVCDAKCIYIGERDWPDDEQSVGDLRVICKDCARQWWVRVLERPIVKQRTPYLQICTKESPYTYTRDYFGARWAHPDAREQHEDDGFVTYKCPNCGESFTMELPQ